MGANESKIAEAVVACLISSHETDRNLGDANIVDAVMQLGRNVYGLRKAITSDKANDRHEPDLTKAAISIGCGLHDMALAIRELAKAIEQKEDAK